MTPAIKQNKGQKKKAEERSFRVKNLKERLQSQGRRSGVHERRLTSTGILFLSRITSVSELDSLFVPNDQCVVWISDSVYMYKRNSCDLLEYLDDMNGVQFDFCWKVASVVMRSFELHWDSTESKNVDVKSSIGLFVRALARIDAVEVVWVWKNLRRGVASLPIDRQDLACLFGMAASRRIITFDRIAFQKDQCPALFSSKDGSVVIRELELGVSLLDGAASLCRALEQSFGVTELDLVRVHQAAENTFELVMTGLYNNRLVRRLNIARSKLSDIHIKALCAAVRRSTYLKHLDLSGCTLTCSQWENLWKSVKVNKSIATIEITSTLPHATPWGLQLRTNRVRAVENALQENHTLVEFLHDDGWGLEAELHSKELGKMIRPYLVKNRVRARAQAVAAEARQGKRWAVLGSALRHRSVRRSPLAMFAFLRANADTVVANAPSGKEVLARQLEKLGRKRDTLGREREKLDRKREKLDRERAAVKDRLREYEESERRASASRKRLEALEGALPSGARKKARS
jgi:hypothetical protein